MIGISTKTGNTEGDMLFNEDPQTSPEILQARISRSKTLDGDSVIVNSGFSEGDRTITLVTAISEADYEKLRTIFKTELLVNLSLSDGFYTAAIESIQPVSGKTQVKILIEGFF